MTTVTLDEFVNSSLIEDIVVSTTIAILLDEFLNSSVINNIVIVLVDEFVNSSTINSVNINSSYNISLNEFLNSSTIEDISNVHFILTLDSYSNIAVIENISPIFDQIINLNQFVSNSTIYQILVNSQKIEPVPARPVELTRPKFDQLNVDEKLTVLDNKVFSDFSIHFKAHPLTGSPAIVFNEASINQSLKMIFFTDVYERPFSNIGFGASISKMLFENFTPSLRNDFVTIALELITNNEPRIIIRNIDVVEESRNSIIIIVEYKIKKTGQLGRFTQALERA